MRSRSRLLHRASLAAAALAVVAVVLAGCSTSSPTGSTTEDWGSLTGTVSSDRGAELSNIEVHLWARIGEGGTVAQYSATTGPNGAYEVEVIDLSYVTGSSADYELYVNRTKGSVLPIDTEYGTYAATVTVEKGTVATANVEIVDAGPVDPEQYFD